MNYQKLFSRFYYTNESNTPENPSSIVESESEPRNNNEEFDFQDNDEEVSMYSENETSQTWEQKQDQQTFTSEPLAPEQVRWFYKGTDDKIWTEFNGYDSLLIENEYRSMKEINQEVENSENLENLIHIDKVVKNNDNTFQSIHNVFNLNNSKEDISESPSKKSKKDIKENVQECDKTDYSNLTFRNEIPVKCYNITVRGGMYEVDLLKMICESIYWPGEQYTITRGLYFYDGSWQPLEGCYGEILEIEHLKIFSKNDNIERIMQSGIAIHSHHFTDFHVEWLSLTDIYLYWGGAPRQLVRSVTQKLGFYQSTGYKLKRGYRVNANYSERPTEITHVIFVIHGIGQKMDSGRIIRNTNALRTSCDWLRSQYSYYGKSGGRAELFPARWRAGERGDAAQLLAATAPLGAPALRRAINDAAMDVMYYTSPIYGKQVQNDLTCELNRLYTMFMTRNPNYKGQFSAVAHSLGCVILYDIITNYEMGCEKCASMNDKPIKNENSKLLFQLQQVFCLGSPLGVFLSLRQPMPGSPRIFPNGFNTKLYNIFHLSDPVAYRLEPLIASWMAKHPPIVIPAHYSAPITSPSTQNSPARGPWRIWSYVKHPWQRSETESPTMSINNSEKNTGSPKENEVLSDKTINNDNLEDGENDKIYQDTSDNTVKFNESTTLEKQLEDKVIEIADEINDGILRNPDEINDGILRNPDEILPHRIDYTLRDSFITNNCIWAIASHTSYWNNYDVAHFILSHLFHEINNSE